MDVRMHIKHKILATHYKIIWAAYHGGDFNGVNLQKIMAQAKEIFAEIEEYLLSYQHDVKQASENEIKTFCNHAK
jgi:hypothetical protein